MTGPPQPGQAPPPAGSGAAAGPGPAAGAGGAAGGAGDGAAARPGRRPDESMSLLRDLLDNPLDAGYLVERGDRARAPAPAWRKVLIVLACAVIGAGAVWSAKALRPAQAATTARAVLLEQIEDRTAHGRDLGEANANRQAEIERLRDAGLAGLAPDRLERLRHLGVAAGSARVRGPGITITLTDSRNATSGAPGAEEQRVKDVDLQVLVNALWSAGAEAIAVNGERLGPMSAIRAAGQTVLVNLVPVVSPYQVTVVGDPADLQTGLARTAAATHLGVLRTTYGITVEVAPAEDLELDGAPAQSLRHAVPAGSGRMG
ncbi:DUF881 domain-containing protein [Georgenia sp. TF02-10]|uniref:DUF881 domain-containing protein n=1 Tax=Georgenia sp. TF02-10 TaxID=2917725 RepID=UPI001FA76C64|nr:DUF881 domain-containing protein [Georgenia sp. TF02-10]UNX53154.1 DUF881 domain-containing protein [Georgenia sp. TF02-10]